MRKKWIFALALSALFLGSAYAEIYAGVAVAARSVYVEAPADGVLEALDVSVGQTVSAGERLGAIRTTKVFAAQDGTVALINADEGDRINGAVLEIAPQRRYTIYCTSEDAYESPEAMRIHAGETLYVKCKTDGTHRGIGVVTGVSENEYQVETIGGALYVGEVVRLYRDEAFSAERLVGVGTVTETCTESYEADETIVQMNVAAGETVERGQLLYTCVSGESPLLFSTVDGIVVSVSAAQGDRLTDGQIVAELVPLDATPST